MSIIDHGRVNPLLNNHQNIKTFTSLLKILENVMQGEKPEREFRGPFELNSMASAEMALKLSIQKAPQENWVFLYRVFDYFLDHKRENSLETIIEDANLSMEEAVKITIDFLRDLSKEFNEYNLGSASHALH